MNNREFSSEFDILYNNITSNQAPGLTEYEKSVFLTKAQESIVLGIYKGTFNNDSFENTEEVTSYIDILVKQVTLTDKVESSNKISKNSIFYQLPEDIWFTTYESVIFKDPKLGCKDGEEVIVIPIKQDSYSSISKNPFRRANDRRVLRLLIDGKAELISEYNIESYLIRYLSKPEPIILEDLTDYQITIDGKTQISECKLHPALHNSILDRAVQIAKSVWAAGA